MTGSERPAGRFDSPSSGGGRAHLDELARTIHTASAGRYTVERVLGRGGMATVYLAHDGRHDAQVAIKVLEHEVSAAGAERFRREIRTAAKLTHPHVLGLHDSGEAPGVLFYVMPYVKGETLRSRLTREGALGTAEGSRLLREIADALAYAHGQGVVHRDLKPENILLSGGHAVVADFGIARALTAAAADPAEEGDGPEHPSYASVSTLLGTPAYMAPEQARGDPAVDHRADLYALGVVGYEMLAGEHPFGGRPGNDASQTRPLEERRPEVPAETARLIRRLLAADPAGRPQSAQEVLQALDGRGTEPAHPPAAVPSFIAELKRRKVFRAGAYYVTAAFVVLQAADLVVPAVHLPERVMTLLVVLALLGLPVTLVLAWAFDVVPGDRTRAAATARGPLATLRWVLPLLATILLVAAGRYAWHRLSSPSENLHTLAVLPFVNTSGVAGDTYFSDGMTDELAYALARLPGVRLAGRTSSYAFRDRDVPVQQIGRVLDVGAVVTGTVRRSGGRLRVTTQLVSTRDGKVLWDSIYESATGDVFTVQDELTRAIVGALAPSLGERSAAGAAAGGRGTRSQEAYDLYLKGRYYWQERGTENVQRAISYFRQAIAVDPRFARAHAGLAMAYHVLPSFDAGSADSAYALSAAAARRALALDSTVADVQIAAAGPLEREFRFTEAEARYRRALAIEPYNVTAHHWLGFLLLSIGRANDAIPLLQQAAQLDPLAKSAGSSVAVALYTAGRYDEAIAAAERVLVQDTTFAISLYTTAMALLMGGQPDSAVTLLERAVRLEPMSPGVHSALLFAYAAAGRWADAERIRAELRRPGGDPSGGAEAALAELVAGDREPMIRLLSTRRGQLMWFDTHVGFGCNPLLTPLWSDQRFRAAMRAIRTVPCANPPPWPFQPPAKEREPARR